MLGLDDGEKLELGSSSVTLKAGRETPPGGLVFSLVVVAPGAPGPAPHAHEESTGSFYVLDGTLALRWDDGEAEIGAGDYALVPPGTVHGIANRSGEPVRLLNIVAP